MQPVQPAAGESRLRPRVVIGTYGNAIDISADGRAALPVPVRQLLEPTLTYTHYIRQMGFKAWDAQGHRHPMRTEQKVLFTYDGLGRLVTKAGFLPQITQKLDEAGYRVQHVERTPVHSRPDRFRTDWDEVFRLFQLKARQDETLAALAGHDRGIIEAPTGYGKSFSFSCVPVLFPEANILIVCTRKDVVETIVRQLAKYVPSVGQIGGGKHNNGRVLVCTAQSLHHVKFDDTDIVLADEAHELAAGTYAKNLGRFNWARMFAFSASPWGRQDGTSIRLRALFGENIFTMTYQEALALDLVVPIRVEWLNVALNSNPAGGLNDVPRRRYGLWRNDERNAIIAAKAGTYGPDEQVLIMCTTFEHAVHLRQHLPDYTLCYAERAEDDKLFTRYVRDGLLPENEPRMTDRRRQQLRLDFEAGKLKKAIATDIWSTGVSFNGLSVLIRADARSSTIMDTQIPGRVCRKHAPTDKSVGILVDCLDQFDAGFRDAARKRRRNYEAKGWEQFVPSPPRLLNA